MQMKLRSVVLLLRGLRFLDLYWFWLAHVDLDFHFVPQHVDRLIKGLPEELFCRRASLQATYDWLPDGWVSRLVVVIVAGSSVLGGLDSCCLRGALGTLRPFQWEIARALLVTVRLLLLVACAALVLPNRLRNRLLTAMSKLHLGYLCVLLGIDTTRALDTFLGGFRFIVNQRIDQLLGLINNLSQHLPLTLRRFQTLLLVVTFWLHQIGSRLHRCSLYLR